ncbi:hypothetical protein AVEN_95345-1 [Araneus ventricosus]|uniref:Uncharacterized protein n=1 Tax=Araneus ventricosus TaxID=182803 RepID=A0A4Y2EFS5_ARAVE|nr:hypothetical protein AVEN_95345-1 [Araneus ventricosus]
MAELEYRGRSPSSHHRPRPDPSRRRYVLSIEEGLSLLNNTVPTSRSQNPLTCQAARTRGAPRWEPLQNKVSIVSTLAHVTHRTSQKCEESIYY